ncbi:hypothetical protein SLS53_008218 [Cytospora paraplurivora]|uniref:RBR-type E3 ubiquitin transferase n=1 Tax=Cytospora paraplurivora TaxID=2898453 RepID=A0AAN9YD04_9PEZI
MSFNDGHKLLVFGLGFAQQDNRKMQQVLRHYDRLPSDPGSRVALFIELNNLAKELMADEAAQDQIEQLTEWMKDGGSFPFSLAPGPLNAAALHGHQDAGFGRLSDGIVISGGYQLYGRGRTIEDFPEDGQEVASSETATDGIDDTDTHSADDDFGNTSMEQYGPGRTIDDPPEALNPEDGAQDSDDHIGQHVAIDTQILNHGTQWGSRAAQHYRHYGRGRALDDSVNEGTGDDLVSDTISTPQEEGVGEDNFKIEGSQPQYVVEENRSDGELPHNEAAMSSDEPHDAEDIECPICLEEYSPSQFPRRPTITEFCDHSDKACLQCLESSITAMVERGALHLLACPICPQKLSHIDIKQYANKEIYKRYQYLKQQSEIPGHWISCTNPNCGGSQAHESDDPRMICKHCNFFTCAKHKRPWHNGQTCGEFDQDPAQIDRLEEEEATAKLLSKESTSICPNCRQGVTKTDGCDHMRCQCGQEWCYVCSCSWENILRIGETAHATFCIYHPNKVKLTKAQQDATHARIMGLVHGGEVSAELAKARDELRERRRIEIRAKAAEAAEARRLQSTELKRTAPPQPEQKKKKFKLVAPWEEGGWTRKAL